MWSVVPVLGVKFGHLMSVMNGNSRRRCVIGISGGILLGPYYTGGLQKHKASSDELTSRIS
jgi:hypothetical protein